MECYLNESAVRLTLVCVVEQSRAEKLEVEQGNRTNRKWVANRCTRSERAFQLINSLRRHKSPSQDCNESYLYLKLINSLPNAPCTYYRVGFF